jgi:hypothetical protein
VFVFVSFISNFLAKFNKKLEKLVEFTLEKKFQNFPNLFVEKERNFARKKKH